ncbi:MAG: hypothetical protein J4432_02620 [DPANN group archaeon]|nr:hypothetical protein [DPANN group archaeon]
MWMNSDCADSVMGAAELLSETGHQELARKLLSAAMDNIDKEIDRRESMIGRAREVRRDGLVHYLAGRIDDAGLQRHDFECAAKNLDDDFVDPDEI